MSNIITFGVTPVPPKKCLTCKKPRWHWNGAAWDCLNCAHANPCVTQHGRGPTGKHCRDCQHLQHDRHHDAVYLKCDLRVLTRGAASDHRAKWQACALFEPLPLDPRAEALRQQQQEVQ